jgi:hypothetical protein
MRDNYIRAHGLALLAVQGAPTDGTTLEDYVRALKAERDRLRAVVEAAIRHIEQEQFRGNSTDPLNEVYRVLHDESITPAAPQLDRSANMGGPDALPVYIEDGSEVPEPYASDVRRIAREIHAGPADTYRTNPAAWDRYMRSDAAQAEWDAEVGAAGHQDEDDDGR